MRSYSDKEDYDLIISIITAYMQFISRLLLVAIIMAAPFSLYGKRQVPDFRSGFKLLESNCLLYRAYNDSVHAKMDETEWVKMMGRRAERFRTMYGENNEIIKSFTDYFQQDRSRIPAEAYDSMFVCIKKAFDDFILDNFLVEHFTQLVMPYYETKGDTTRLIQIRHIAGLCNTEIARFQDTDAGLTAKRLFEENIKLADNSASLSVEAMSVLPLDIMNYAYTLASLGFISPSETQHGIDRLRRFVEENSQRMSERQKKRCDMFLDRLLTRSARIHQHSVLQTHEDSLALSAMYANSPFSKMQAADLKSTEDSVYYYQYKKDMNEISVQEADRMVYRLTLELFDSIEKLETVTEFNIQTLSNVLMASVSLMDKNPQILPMSRTMRVSSLCKRLVAIVQRTHIVQDPFFLESMLGDLACMKSIFKYLPAEEKINFMSELAVKSQIGTVIHVGTVDRLAEVVFAGLLKHCPEQFLGVMGMNSVEDLHANRAMLGRWVGMAASYHDLGKIGISPIFSDDFRRLTEREFKLSRMHPELAEKYLDVDSLFHQFKDVALGHHKWYNGKGGYPSSFDNTKSPWRSFIDLVTICDCIDAATDNINRNYRKSKTLKEVLSEFKRDAGTVYNPVMVDAISGDAELCRQIENIITEQRYEQLRDVRSRYMK